MRTIERNPETLGLPDLLILTCSTQGDMFPYFWSRSSAHFHFSLECKRTMGVWGSWMALVEISTELRVFDAARIENRRDMISCAAPMNRIQCKYHHYCRAPVSGYGLKAKSGTPWRHGGCGEACAPLVGSFARQHPSYAGYAVCQILFVPFWRFRRDLCRFACDAYTFRSKQKYLFLLSHTCNAPLFPLSRLAVAVSLFGNK